MKTVISLLDRLFEEADRLAMRGMSRSELYARAIADFVESQKGLGVRARLDAVYALRPEKSALDPELAVLQEKSLRGKSTGAKKW